MSKYIIKRLSPKSIIIKQNRLYLEVMKSKHNKARIEQGAVYEKTQNVLKHKVQRE